MPDFWRKNRLKPKRCKGFTVLVKEQNLENTSKRDVLVQNKTNFKTKSSKVLEVTCIFQMLQKGT